MLSGLSLLLAVLACETIDGLARPARGLFGGGRVALAWRATAIASIWFLAFALTGRPLLAFTATAVTTAILVAISNLKRRFLREPLVFSDFALLEHLFRHPQLFYMSRRWTIALIAAAAVTIAAIAAWMALEPRSASGTTQAGALLVAVAAMALVWFAPAAGASAARLVGEPDLEADIARIGLLASLAAYTAAWRHERAPQRPAPEPLTPPYDAIVVIQAESFVDVRRLGHAGLQLPAYDRLRQRALAHGLLDVPCQGAYTLRPESAIITGLGFHEQGFDRFHPYLRPHRLAAASLPRRLSKAGWDTLFVHPHDGTFFRRNRAMPALGFARFADENAFAGARRTGPYISDDAVADLLLTEIAERGSSGRRLFVHAVTMEAHDPYGPGRLPDENDPVRQYIRHIENADRMLARLADALDRGEHRVLLVFFGDHVPFLPDLADPFSDTRTDFLAVELGRNASRTAVDVAVSRPEHLSALIGAGLQQR